MEKHHGVVIEEIILILPLYPAYGVTSIKQLERKAKKDKALAAVIKDIGKINNKVLHYFQGRNEVSTLEELLDNVMRATQKDPRFRSRKEGIVATDDSGLGKDGKKMEHIEIIFDHARRRYLLGYVIVVVSYADSLRAYPVNFEFRLRSEEEKRQAEMEAKKKKEKIDLRKKGSLLKVVELQEKSGQAPDFLEVTGVNLDGNTLRKLDEKDIPWIGIPNGKTLLVDREGNRWSLDALKSKTRKNKLTGLQVQGWQIHSKKVVLTN